MTKIKTREYSFQDNIITFKPVREQGKICDFCDDKTPLSLPKTSLGGLLKTTSYEINTNADCILSNSMSGDINKTFNLLAGMSLQAHFGCSSKVLKNLKSQGYKETASYY